MGVMFYRNTYYAKMTKLMTHKELREKYLEFVKSKGFEFIPSASLVPENDPSVLFTTAGVQPLVPYLMGEKHPKGTQLSNIQKCVRTVDLEDIGDDTHLSFFEMLGYWYLGGENLKEKGVETTYEMFFTDKGFNLSIDKAYVTCYENPETGKKDEVSANKWKELGISEDRIFYTTDSNWWETGESGPCGPDTEVFYDISDKDLNITSPEDFKKADDAGEIVEIGNTVFMLHEKQNGEIVGDLPQQNVDFGGGFERLLMVLNGKNNVYETELFEKVLEKVNNNNHVKPSDNAARIIADHIRTSVMMISDGVLPSNTDAGYILRRLLRRVVRFAKQNSIEKESISEAAQMYVDNYQDVYKIENSDILIETIKDEIEKFEKTLEKGLREFEKMSKDGNISGHDAFILFTSHGFPFEITEELAKEKGVTISKDEFDSEMVKHQEQSRTSSAGKFKGGLAGDSEVEIKYHTATHLLNAALRKELGDHISQKGSNINTERMRFDFTHEEKVERDVLDKIEAQVNEWIQEDIPVEKLEMSLGEAKEMGAIGVFDDKYGDVVSVYKIGPSTTLGTSEIISLELCGGPHVKSTGEIGEFKIKKEESSSKGVRRIKAIVE
jgi:alanyl-tRNA synthetase